MHEFDISWRVNSACQGLDPDIFYPESEDNCDQAIAICESCHVRIACLNYALETREKQGVWEVPRHASVVGCLGLVGVALSENSHE